MKITEIYVERLKSYGDYSNRRVGLRAVLDENDSVEEAYRKLAEMCETLVEMQEIRSRREILEKEIKEYEGRYEALRKIKEEYAKIRDELLSELNRLREELEKIELLAEEKHLKLRDEIISKIREIRRALNFFDPI